MHKVLLVSNPRAGTTSPRTKEVIVKALAADFKLEVADTAARGHASELAADAVDRDFEAVLAFGGDGTINEVSQGLVGSEVALGMLPGGSTNVFTRSVGVPRDPVEATAFVASRLRSQTRRRIHVGTLTTDGEQPRHFLFAAGMGLDAEVVKRVEADPEAKRRRGEWFFLRNAIAAGLTDYRSVEPAIEMRIQGSEPERLVFVVCCNSRPFTYFKRMPVDACPEARLDRGLDLFGLTKVRAATVPRVAWGVLVSRSHVRWRNGRYHHDVDGADLRASRPLPVQVDGDYIGDRSGITLGLQRSALDLLV